MTDIKLADNYICKICDYITSRSNDMKKHLSTVKHKTRKILTKSRKTRNLHEDEYYCECGKVYRHRQSLSTHRKKCVYTKLTDEDSLTNTGTINNTQNTIQKLEYENEILKLKNEILRMSKNEELVKQTFMTGNNININNITKSQLNFNNKNEIKIFLSEQCSNALSVQEFIKQLSITLDDLMKTKDNAVTGIIDIIKRNLKPLTLTNRPVHYIRKDEWFMKDKEEWKEDDGDTLVDKTHKKLQKDFIDRYTKNEISNLQDDETMELLLLITKEMEYKNIMKIKDELSNNCELYIKTDDHCIKY
jgi:hypothetical protein